MSNKLNEKPKQSNEKKKFAALIPGFVVIPKIIIDKLVFVSPAAIKVYTVIRSFKPTNDDNTGKYSPSLPTVWARADLSRDTVERALEELEKHGFIIRGKSKGKPNNYFFPDETERLTAPSVVATGAETDAEYLDRKQLEFPQHNVKQIFTDFKDKCGGDKYPKMKPTRRKFDDWLQNQDEVMQPLPPLPPEPFDEQAYYEKKYGSQKSGGGEYVNPVTGKRLK
jgi:DNA-binding transcriptional regulator YhcF (GntR family)